MTNSVPYPSGYDTSAKKWLICEWFDEFTGDSWTQDGASVDSLADTRDYVNAELDKFYRDIGEDCPPLHEYVTGPVTSTASNIIYDLPDEDTAPDRVLLSRTTNGDRVFGLSAWKNGYNPDFADD
jgi:hypothetical protein